MVTDPLGDFLSRLQNATRAGKPSLAVPYSKLKHAVAEKLRARGFIKSLEKRGKKVKKTLEIELMVTSGLPKIAGVERISKPGRRLYQRVSEIRAVRGGTGAVVLSTPKGILTGDEARKENVGGEVLFKIW